MSRTYYMEDYRFGIICALPLVQTAVEAMLDDIHVPQPALPGDNNVYTFGSIGKHRVVVTSLGVGTYGTASATEVTNDLRRSYPMLKYGLVVGIAGAIPRPGSRDGDIRLGDIVIGCVNGAPSIVNYGLGKRTDNGFEVRSELAEPPEALSRAVAALEVQHQRLGPTYLIHLSDMLRNNPRLNQPELKHDYYNFPNVPDVLFNAQPKSAVYKGLYRIGAVAGESEVVRSPRYLRNPPDALNSEKFIRLRDDGFADYPAAFCGSIGSADMLLESAVHRDAVFDMVKQQRNAELLCLETVAAGTVNGWPCLNIRGICDYSDSKKNEDWQNFAAATAAAYAKDLLIRIPPEMMRGGRSIADTVKNGQLETTHYRIEKDRLVEDMTNRLQSTRLQPNRSAPTDITLCHSGNAKHYHTRSDSEPVMPPPRRAMDDLRSDLDFTPYEIPDWSPNPDRRPPASTELSCSSISKASALYNQTSPALGADQGLTIHRALISAALAGKLEQVQTLHINGGDINSSDGPSETPTALAAAISQYRRLSKITNEPLEAIKESIAHHVTIFSQIIRYLVSNGAKWDREDPEIESAIKHIYKEIDHLDCRPVRRITTVDF